MISVSSIPKGGRAIMADLAGKSVRLSASPEKPGACSLEGDSIQIGVEPEHLGHAITGRCPAGVIDLHRHLAGNSNSQIITGSIGKSAVELEARDWSGNETTISGYVGSQRVQVSQRHQLDGSVLSGYLGVQRFSLREREIPGQGLDLQPLEYLPVLACLGQKLDVSF